MKIIPFRFFLYTFVFIIALSFTSPALAHVDEPRLEINTDRLNPGGVVDVRGVAFDYEESVTLALIGSQADIPLGEITANLEGEFLHIVVLPSDLVEGTYYFRATTSHHWALSPPLTVWGTAMMEGGGQGLRDEDDPLLAPMPTFAPAVATAPIASVPVAATPASTWNPNILALVVLIVIGIIVLFAIKRKTVK